MVQRTRQRPLLSGATQTAVLQVLAPLELRLTKHRRSLLSVLENTSRPLTVDELVVSADVPMSTAYRNLAGLVDAGIVVRVAGAGSADRYELAERLSQRHHHHLVCTGCGLVTDFDASSQLEKLIDVEIEALLATSGFEITHHVFDVRGLCSDCVTG
ncbi:MAG: transcriptional repressor [Actinobacteria bacterium]|nr:transcriptional repressor [Actinomycetota bacterium]